MDARFGALGCRVILADDFKKPACMCSACCCYIPGTLSAYVELVSVNALQFDRYRILAGLQIVDIACSMRGQVRMPILLAGYLILPIQAFELERSPSSYAGVPHPSYRPTASCTKSRASSGSKIGRRAVVRSRGWRNIQYHGFTKCDALRLCLLPI